MGQDGNMNVKGNIQFKQQKRTTVSSLATSTPNAGSGPAQNYKSVDNKTSS
jgi:hypothetical protein